MVELIFVDKYYGIVHYESNYKHHIMAGLNGESRNLIIPNDVKGVSELWYQSALFLSIYYQYFGGKSSRPSEQSEIEIWYTKRKEFIIDVYKKLLNGEYTTTRSSRAEDILVRDLKDIDKIIIHHSHHTLEGLAIDNIKDYIVYLSTFQFLNLVLPEYLTEGTDEYKKVIEYNRTFGDVISVRKEGSIDLGKPVYEDSEVREAPLFASYHYLILPDGSAYQVCPLDIVSWHAKGTYSDELSINERSIGICFIGNHDLVQPTDSALETAKAIISHLQKQFNITNQNILGHKESHPSNSATSCPGTTFYEGDIWKYKLLS